MNHSDIASDALKTPVDLDFEKVSLDNVLAYLAEVVPGLCIVLDPQIALAGIDLTTRVVDLKVKAVSVDTVLRLVLGCDLGYKIKDNYVFVTTVEELYQDLPAQVLDVADIIGCVSADTGSSSEAAAMLVDLVQRTVNNMSDRSVAAWADEGGPASIEFFNNKLVVTQTEQAFHRIARLLADLRQNLSRPVWQRPGSISEQIGKVFIVHGRDLGVKEEVARFLKTLDLSAVVIGEQGRGLFALLETIEQNAFASDFAVVLLTPDDLGAGKDDIEAAQTEPDKIKCLGPRARQNVVFELGYLAGALGRSRVCALRKGSLEIFGEMSDMKGIFCPEMDAAGGWKTLIAQALKDAGIKVDLNKLAK